MGALKLTACMKVVSEMSDLDRDALLDRLDGYLDDGVPKERAQVMAASDMLAELEDERREFMRMLKEQHPEIFVVTAPKVRQSADRPIFTDDILKTAIAESKAMSGVIGSAIENDAQGVIPGRPRMLDRGLAKGTYTEEEVQAEFPRTLEAIRAAHGEELTLWRADAPTDRRIAEARTVYMADQDVATKYANNGRQALPYRVKTDDLLGVYARPSGYYEAIVRIPEGGLKPADGEGLRQSADRIQPDFVVDDEEEANAKYAEFDDGRAYVKFFADNKGSLRVITINAEESDSVSGRGILQWLRDTYGMPIIANEVDIPAIGFWDKMQSEGLVKDWSHQMYRGKTRALPEIRKSADRTPLGFYSALARSIDGVPIKSAPAGAWKTAIKGLLNKGAIKQDELEWSGLEDWLDLEGQPKPVYESGYGLVEEYQKDDGTWEQVDDLGSYFRTQEEAEAGITDEMRQASEKWAKKEGATSRVAVKKFDQLNFGKTMTPKISKEQVAEYLEQGGVQVEETVLGGTDYAGGLHVDQSDSGSWHVVDDEARVFDGPFDTEEEADAAMAKMAQGQAPSKYSQYTLPGGENYREVLLTLPSKEPTTVTRFQVLTSRGELVQTVRDRARAERLAEGLEGYTVREVQMPGSDNPGANLYRSNHWNQPNVLAHIRMNDRTDAEGKRVLFVEELQSDWGQEGKKKGFKGEPQFVAGMEGDPAGFIGANASGVPKAPFVNKTEGWLNLALKRVMVMAAEGGYDKVAFTTGSQNAERFSLDKHLREIAYEPAGDGKYEITATDLRGREVISEDEVGLDRVEELVGKEIAEKVSRDEGERDAGGYREWRYLRGDNLKVEAKGMRAFYDTIVPTALKKLLPKVGGEQVGVVNINSDFNVFQIDDGLWGNNVDERTFSSEAEARKAAGTPQPGFDVTDAMREKVAGGLPLFSPDRAQIKTPEFKKWFGKSKVVNGIGKPRVVYHGTAGDVAIFDMGRAGQTYGLKDEQAFFFTGYIPTAESAADDATDLPVYRRKYMNEGFGGGMDRGDSYGGYDDGDSYDYTADYNGGQNIMPVYLSLQNPLIIDADQGYGAGTHLELRGSESPGELIARAKAEGHDGIIIRGKYRNYESIARINNNNWLSDQEKKKYLDRLAREDARKQQTDNYFIAFRPDQIKSAIGNIGAFGQRPVTAEEAERFGMGEMEAEYRQYEGDIRFSADRDYEPKKTVKAYKLFRVKASKPGQLFPLFVDPNTPVPMGVWLRAQEGEAAAPSKTGKPQVKSKLGPLAYRPGWHAGDVPIATHIGGEPAVRFDEESGTEKKLPTIRKPDEVWAEVEMSDDVDWQSEADRRAIPYKSSNPATGAVKGEKNPGTAAITDGIPKGGHYRYKTNPNMTGNWMIGGEIKVLRILSDSEVQRINKKAGVADLPRKEPLDLKKYGFPAGRPTLLKSEDRDSGEITIDLSADKPSRDRAKAWVAKVNEMFPRNPMNGRQRVMMFGEDDMAIFELDDSVTVPGAAEVKWFQAYPLRSGNGTKGMQELQRLAAEDNMPLTLYPWDKGRVSQAALIKFYKKNGFTPIRKGGKDLVWRPEPEITKSADRLIEDIPNEDWLQGKIDYAKSKGRNQFGVPFMGAITGYFKGPVDVSLRVLSKLKGERDEQNNVRDESLDYIRQNWDEVSKQPPYIEVAYNGEAWVSEGNHRIMVAAEKGLESMPVEIRYFDGGQRMSGPLAPGRIPSLEAPDIFKSADRPWFDDLSKLKVSTNYQLGDLLKSSKKLNWWNRTVGTQYNLAQKNPEFKRVFDAVQTFINDVSAYASRAADLAPTILPKLETLKDLAKSPLSAEDVKALRDPIFGGTLKYTRDDEGNIIETDDVSTAGVVFTNDELRDLFGLNDRQVKLYREFRRATNKSLSDLAVADMLRYLGKDGEGVRQRALEATNLDGALNAMVAHLDMMIEQQPERAEVLEDSKRAIKEKAGQAIGLMARGYAPLSRFGQYTVYVVGKDGEQIYFSMFETQRDANKMAREMQDQYPEATVTTGIMSQESYKLFSGVTPETLALFGESLGLEESGIDAKSEVFQQYLKMAKTNRSAMKRLIQRKGIDGFSEDAGRVLAGFVYSNARQISTNLHAGEIGRSASEIQDGDVKDHAIRLMQYIQNPTEEAQALKGLIFNVFLGGNISSALVNISQTATTTFPYLSQFDSTASVMKRLGDATKLAVRGIRGDDELRQALKRAEDEGIVSPQEVFHLMAQAQGKAQLQTGDGTRLGDALAKTNNFMTRATLVWGRLFSAAEQANRRIAFIAAYKMARDKGMENPFAFAEKTVLETQFSTNKGIRPAWARGAVGGVLFTFKGFTVAYLELLGRMLGNGPEGRKAFGLALGTLFLFAGAGGLPFMDDLDDVIDGFAQRVLNKSFDSKQAKREFFASLLGQTGADFVMSGISSLPGAPIDVSGRLGLGNIAPGTGTLTKKSDYQRDVMEIFGPAGSLFSSYATAIGMLAQGEVKQAATTAAPLGFQNVIKGMDMAQMGFYRDTRGRKVIDTNGWEAVAKSMGFQPASVKRIQDATSTQQGLIAQNKLRETEIADKMAKARIERKPELAQEAREELADWNRKNPESPIRIDAAQINRRVQQAMMTKAKRLEKTAPKEIRADVKRELERAQ